MSGSTYFFVSTLRPGGSLLEGKFASPRASLSETSADDLMPLSQLAGLYWFAVVDGDYRSISTEEVAAALEQGDALRAVAGPFPTREDAARSIDMYRGGLMDDDN